MVNGETMEQDRSAVISVIEWSFSPGLLESCNNSSQYELNIEHHDKNKAEQNHREQ